MTEDTARYNKSQDIVKSTNDNVDILTKESVNFSLTINSKVYHILNTISNDTKLKINAKSFSTSKLIKQLLELIVLNFDIETDAQPLSKMYKLNPSPKITLIPKKQNINYNYMYTKYGSEY